MEVENDTFTTHNDVAYGLERFGWDIFKMERFALREPSVDASKISIARMQHREPLHLWPSTS